MRNISKIITIILPFLICMYCFSTTALAADNLQGIFDKGNSFISEGEANQSDTIDATKLNEGINTMYSIIMAVGGAIATIVGVIVGIKLMTAATGDEKAKYKKILIAYLAGCVVIFGSYGIWKLVVSTVNSIV